MKDRFYKNLSLVCFSTTLMSFLYIEKQHTEKQIFKKQIQLQDSLMVIGEQKFDSLNHKIEEHLTKKCLYVETNKK